MTNTFKEQSLKHIFQNADIPAIGDATGLRGSAVAGSLYVSLHTADPGGAGSQNSSECAYTSYARVAVARSAAGWAVSTGASPVADNVAAVLFPQATGGSETATHVGLGTDAAGAGNLKMRAPLGSVLGPFVAENSTDLITIKGHGLAVDMRISFYALPRGAVLPAGLVEAQIYWVKTVPDVDNITIAATQGGATVDVTADGDGFAFKNVPLPISNGIQPQFLAGTLDFAID